MGKEGESWRKNTKRTVNWLTSFFKSLSSASKGRRVL
jgi:hypothetical protein